MTTGSIESLEQSELELRGARTLSVLRIRLSDAGLVPALSSFLSRMGFNTATVADDTIEVEPISPVSPSYDACTMRAYFRSWHARHAQVEAKLSA
jgi:hypothetical protein